MLGSKSEKRLHPRYRVTLPIQIGEVSGMTTNISTGGVVFISPARFVVGDAVSFTIRFSKGQLRMPVTLQCTGQVVRECQLPDGSFETAFTIASMQSDSPAEARTWATGQV